MRRTDGGTKKKPCVVPLFVFRHNSFRVVQIESPRFDSCKSPAAQAEELPFCLRGSYDPDAA
jgi:hypothetical protein